MFKSKAYIMQLYSCVNLQLCIARYKQSCITKHSISAFETKLYFISNSIVDEICYFIIHNGSINSCFTGFHDTTCNMMCKYYLEA